MRAATGWLQWLQKFKGCSGVKVRVRRREVQYPCGWTPVEWGFRTARDFPTWRLEGEGQPMQRGVHHGRNPNQGTQMSAGTTTLHVDLKLQTPKPRLLRWRSLLDDLVAESLSEFLQAIGVVAGHVHQDLELWQAQVHLASPNPTDAAILMHQGTNWGIIDLDSASSIRAEYTS